MREHQLDDLQIAYYKMEQNSFMQSMLGMVNLIGKFARTKKLKQSKKQTLKDVHLMIFTHKEKMFQTF